MWHRGSTWLILIGNLLPLSGLVFFKWDALVLASFYWAEAALIMGAELIGPWAHRPWKPYRPTRRLVMGLFMGFCAFCVVTVDTLLMTAIVSMDAYHQGGPLDAAVETRSWPGPFYPLGWLLDVAAWLLAMMGPGVKGLLGMYVLVWAVLEACEIVLGRAPVEQRALRADAAEPFLRLTAGFFMLLCIFMFWMGNWTTPALQFLVAVKISIELFYQYLRCVDGEPSPEPDEDRVL